MGYLASARGDYMRGRGDPGLFSFIGKAVKSVARIGTSFLPGPAGQMARAIVGGGGRRPPQQQQMFPGGIPLRQPFAAPRSFGGGGNVRGRRPRWTAPQEDERWERAGSPEGDASPGRVREARSPGAQGEQVPDCHGEQQGTVSSLHHRARTWWYFRPPLSGKSWRRSASRSRSERRMSTK